MNTAWLANTAWMWSCRRDWQAFRRAARDPAAAQSALLRRMLAANVDTKFGRTHGFAQIRAARDYQERVPSGAYEELKPWIDRAAAGESNVLTREPVRMFEPTSGTSGGQNLIPFTQTLRQQFQRMIGAWVFNLFRRIPAVRAGRAYWSVSPALGPQPKTAGGIPIGFDDDAAYLGRVSQLLLKRILAVPPDVRHQSAIDAFRYATLRWLLRSDDLSLISVWSPTFLTSLLAPLETSSDRLCADLHKDVPHRAREVDAILHSDTMIDDKLRRLWPRLSLISCWADASSAQFIPAIRELFPAVTIQPKGLLATEGCVSFPLIGREGAALALTSHFFEFEPFGADGMTDVSEPSLLAHELETGRRYTVVLTTGGGLYRYRLNDIVEVVDFVDRCPLVRFHGRANLTGDLVGEKLGEPHVRAVLERTLAESELCPPFAFVASVNNDLPGYRVYLQLDSDSAATATVRRLQQRLQQGLEQNPHYHYACRLGQLGAIDVAILKASGPSGWQLYESHCLARGCRVGDIKPAVFDGRADWDAIFAPYVSEIVPAC